MKVIDSKKCEKRISNDSQEKCSTIIKTETNWLSIYIATFLAFVGAIPYYILFSAYWPYLITIDKTATEDFFGYIMAMYSIGQMISAPIFGCWSNKIKQVKLPIFVSFLFLISGNLIYLSLPFISFSFSPKYLLLFGRFLDGIGSSNSAMLRLYASTASAIEDRSQSIGYFSVGQSISAILGPVLQLMFSPLGYPGYQIFKYFKLNIYTGPAYCAIIINLAGIAILYGFFKEFYAGIVETPNTQVPDDAEAAQSQKTPSSNAEEIPNYDFIAVLICLLTRFAHTFFLTNIETIGSAFSQHMFNFSETKAVKYMAASQMGASILTLLVCLAFTFNLFKNFNLRCVCIGSLKALIIFYLITYSWSFIPGQVEMKDDNSTQTNNAGCDNIRFSWCQELSPINVYIYYSLYVLIIGIAFPTLNVALFTLFSTILGPRLQGTMQGIFQISGGIARMLGSFALGNLYIFYGPKLTWKLEIFVLGFTAASWILFYRKMIPLEVEKKIKSSSNSDSSSTELISTKSEKQICQNRVSKNSKV